MIKKYLIISIVLLFCFAGRESYSILFEREDHKLPETIQRKKPPHQKSISPRIKEVVPSQQTSPLNINEVKSYKVSLPQEDEEPGFLLYWLRGLIVILIIPVTMLFIRKLNIKVEFKSFALPIIFLFIIYSLGGALIFFVSHKAEEEIKSLEGVKLSENITQEVSKEDSNYRGTSKTTGIDTVLEWRVYPILYRYTIMSKKTLTNKKIERQIVSSVSPKLKTVDYQTFSRFNVSYSK